MSDCPCERGEEIHNRNLGAGSDRRVVPGNERNSNRSYVRRERIGVRLGKLTTSDDTILALR